MFQENRAPFYADFGEDMFIAGVSARAIFDNGYVGQLGDVVASRSPQLTIADAELARVSAVRGSPVVRQGVSYRIAEIQPDGTPSGDSLVLLERL